MVLTIASHTIPILDMHYGSLLNGDIQIKRVPSVDGVKQHLQLRWRGRLRPRPPITHEHYPRVQPAPHLPQG
jgi:hypothetical protein